MLRDATPTPSLAISAPSRISASREVALTASASAAPCAVPVRYEFAWSVQLGGTDNSSAPLYLPSVSRRALIPAGTLPPALAPPSRFTSPPAAPAVRPPYLPSVPRYLPALIPAGTLPAGQPSAVTLHARAVLADGSRLNARLGLGLRLGLGMGLGLGSA